MSASVQPVFQLEVPLTFLLLPAKADGALRHARLAASLSKTTNFHSPFSTSR